MAVVLANIGKLVTVKLLVGAIAAEQLRLRLFVNDVTPTEEMLVFTFVEASFTGYSSILLNDTWVYTEGSSPYATHPVKYFASSADQILQTVYGWYIVRETSLEVIAAERFSTPPEITLDGQAIKVTPVVRAL